MYRVTDVKVYPEFGYRLTLVNSNIYPEFGYIGIIVTMYRNFVYKFTFGKVDPEYGYRFPVVKVHPEIG